jgi:hypothetical protein
MFRDKREPAMKNTKGNEEEAQGIKEREQFRGKLEDLRNNAQWQVRCIETLIELGKRAADNYSDIDFDTKLRSVGLNVFTDWQGLLLIMEESTEAAKKALQAMDELMIKSIILKATK